VPERTLELSYPASSSTLREIRDRLDHAAGPLLAPAALEDLKLAVTEACANAVLHSGSAEFRVTIDVRGGCVEVVVEDDGVYRSVPRSTGGAKVHRGLLLMASMVDDLSLHRGTTAEAGTQVRLRKCAS
jgi:anti-sigma regulatory factor (Ser/Thr protein kinase)